MSLPPSQTLWRSLMPFRMALGRLRRFSPRPPALLGAWPDRASALAAVPPRWLAGYDHPEVAPINAAAMSVMRLWDYPVVFWLARLQRPGLRVLDIGGHFGTKYIAFRPHLALEQLHWTVQDLPAVVAAARAAQAARTLPAALHFTEDLAEAGQPDLVLASGLLQYLDVPLSDLLHRLPALPPHVILNKVATREGPSVTTLERIGPARVPYQIRQRAGFEAEIAALGYRILDQWEIPSLSHVIDTHPELGASTSRGYVLQR